MRLFLALPLPESIRRELAGLSADVGKARWVPHDQLHVTVRFLGEVGEPDAARLVESIDAGLRARPFPTLRVAIRGVGVFGPPRRPRVLWAGLDPSEPVRRIAEQIEQGVLAVGLPAEERPFSAHVTLARFTRADGARVADLLRARASFETEPFDVPALVLYRSTLSSTGAIHEPVHRFLLGP